MMGRATIRRNRAACALALLLVATPAGAEVPAQPPRDPPIAAESPGTGQATGNESFEPPARGAARLKVSRPPYPDEVERVIEEGRSACRDAEGTGLAAGPGFVRTGDLTGDGRADTVVDFRRARCVGVASLFEGTGGWDLVILVARPAGDPVRVFSDKALDYDITGGPGARVMRFQLHGSRCGRVGTAPCFKRRRLDARPFAFDDP